VRYGVAMHAAAGQNRMTRNPMLRVLSTCRRHARNEDAHFAVVGKAYNQLVNDTILTDGARQRFDLNVVRPVANEMITIETLHL
jgi:hypothetical protein